MPPQFVFDISSIDLNKVIYDQEAIREANPQRGDMEMLNGIVYAAPELGRIVGYKDVRADEFWVPGHIPGRPLLPGVLMVEAAAQLASFYTRKFVGWKGFIGFGGGGGNPLPTPLTPRQRPYIFGQQRWGGRHPAGY